jgi:uncharacterized protein (TIGR02594 family)
MEPAWLTVARGELSSGVYEIPGSGSEQRIEEYLSTCRWVETDDSVPWCAAFVNWCIMQAGLVGTDSARARSWLQFGVSVSPPPVGAVTILKRGPEPQPGRHVIKAKGHVGFYVGEASPSEILLLGGNQSNGMVRVSTYARSKVLQYRWHAGG